MKARPVKSYSFNGLAGCVWQKKAHSTSTTVSIYRNEQAGLDASGDPWSTVCEDHNFIVGRATLTIAKDQSANPHEWCEECRNLNGNRF